ncbi:MAG TPA: ABC transporter ATP-binding protein [Mycobacteriales bacterium]|nr:ABC transporter ATP-binding protein [Mycobacteriales bacterium]
MTTAIAVYELTKDYGRRRALDRLTLAVPAGEVYGFLGPNGAGKTTTLRILLDLLRPTSGRATVLGLDVQRDALPLHRRIAYVPGDVALWPQLTGGQAIDVLLALHGRSDQKRREELVEAFQLDPTVRCRAYSTGNRQKVALVAAFAAEADVLILDEPTSGLDPLMEAVFRRHLVAARDEGRTVLLSSHILGEVETTCDRVGIIRAGRLVETGTLDELRHLSEYTVDAEVGHPPELGGIAGVSDLVVAPANGGYRVRCRVHPEATADLLAALARAGVRTLSSRPPTLEELFLRYYDAAETP